MYATTYPPKETEMTKLSKIEGIAQVYSQKLQEAGIATIEQLLQAAATPQGRRDLVEKAGISGKLILEWANLADLFRIKGIGEEYSDLLEEAGVDTIPELAQRNADNLYAKLGEVNAAKRLVRKLPSRDAIADWIDQAKTLPRVMTY